MRPRRYGIGAALVLAAAMLSGACETPLLVDCAPGRFVRVEGAVWCVYERAPARCPSTLPELHRLSWGGAGCAAEEHDPLPVDRCVGMGDCEPDAGSEG